MREGVDQAPGELLGREVVHSRFLQDLGQRSGVAEHIRQPQIAHVDAELLAEETLALEDLAHQRLAAGDVGVGLHPHAALRLDAARLHLRDDLRPQRRVVLFHPEEVLRLARAEDVIGVFLDVGNGRGEGARALADRLADGPQPAQIHVRVADRAHTQAGIAAALRQQRREDSARRVRVRRDAAVDQVDHVGQPGEDLLIARRILRQHFEEVEQHFVVVEQAAHGLIAGRDGRLFDCAALLQVAEQIVAPASAQMSTDSPPRA